MTLLLGLIIGAALGVVYGRLAPLLPTDRELRIRVRLMEWRIHHLRGQIERASVLLDDVEAHHRAHPAPADIVGPAEHEVTVRGRDGQPIRAGRRS